MLKSTTRHPMVAPSKFTLSEKKTPRTKKITKKSTKKLPNRSFCASHHNLESQHEQQQIKHVTDWSNERKHRIETFNELQAKYVNTPQNPHQEAAGRVLMRKYDLPSQHLSANAPGDHPQVEGVMKLGQGQTSPVAVKQLYDTPLSLLPHSLKLKYAQDPQDGVEARDAAAAGHDIKHNIVVATINGHLWDLQRPIDLTLVPKKNGNTHNDQDGFEIEFHHADSKLGQQVLWHSTAHILGQALELEYQHHVPLLSDGPSLPEGFFYDVYLHDKNGQPFSVEKSKMKSIAQRMQKIVEQEQSFDRLVVTLDDARRVFRYNPFKLDVLDRIQQQQDELLKAEGPKCADMVGVVALYKCGSFVDLCRGPHVLNTNQCGFIEVFKNSASVLKNPLAYEYNPTNLATMTPLVDKDGAEVINPTHIHSVQRVYGISFPTKQQLDDFNKQKARAEEIDHRKLGREQQLFMFHNYSPGSPFWLPHGTRIYNRLVNFLRDEYRQRGYNEVRTPQVFDKTLWEISGHWDNYKEDMFFVSKGKLSLDEQALMQMTHVEAGKQVLDEAPHPHHRLPHNQHSHHKHEADAPIHSETAQQALKPMNCPGHCVLYNSQSFSYRDLPIRYADFSNLHRNEASGALSGLTRVRCFAQDDAHIFARQDQLGDELTDALQFIQDVYKTFNFPVFYKLSTRPDAYIGDLSTWNDAESTLTNILNKMEVPWELNEGDGAFYGPKVDITVKDALGRYHQCATLQLDYNLPRRFGLEYKGADGQMHTPVMIHRAILGSLERFVAVLLEHTEGNLPLWLSPRQVLVTAVSPQCQEYADYVQNKLTAKGIYADVANLNERIAKQVKMAQSLKYNYILTVGEKEIQNDAVTLRLRSHHKPEPEPMKVDDFVSKILLEIQEKKN
jgi:threonyl-tRNA synthetase